MLEGFSKHYVLFWGSLVFLLNTQDFRVRKSFLIVKCAHWLSIIEEVKLATDIISLVRFCSIFDVPFQAWLVTPLLLLICNKIFELCWPHNHFWVMRLFNHGTPAPSALSQEVIFRWNDIFRFLASTTLFVSFETRSIINPALNVFEIIIKGASVSLWVLSWVVIRTCLYNTLKEYQNASYGNYTLHI